MVMRKNTSLLTMPDAIPGSFEPNSGHNAALLGVDVRSSQRGLEQPSEWDLSRVYSMGSMHVRRDVSMRKSASLNALDDLIRKEEDKFESATQANGAFPMESENVKHHGTIQNYRCFQPGPNSRVQLTVPGLWTAALQNHSDREFLVLNDERWTFKQAIQAAEGLARELHAVYGVTKGTIVAIAGRNTPSWVISFIATTLLGAVALPMNSMQSGEELQFVLENSGARVFIADRQRLESANHSSSQPSFFEARHMPAMTARLNVTPTLTAGTQHTSCNDECICSRQKRNERVGCPVLRESHRSRVTTGSSPLP